MEQKRILVVDDERDLCDILLFNLHSAGYLAEAAYSAEDGLEKIAECKLTNSKSFDLLLLDVMMPGMSGFDMAQRLKEDESTRHIPIIFLTAKDTEDDTLYGFSLGADDYVTKPFSVREVMARVKAVLGRGPLSYPLENEENISYGGFILNATNKTLSIDNNSVPLTRTEYELLYLLLSHPAQVFSRQQLLEKVWPQNVIVTERTIDVNIARLRKKLGAYASCLVSRTGFGYCFRVER